ncbi:MAG: SoxR reducing system RseC family protein [Paludibacteraceae bacterium]|nr:SoxR reducing system RseC family protein [Paludibacteraceae bacterium]
MIRHIGVVTAVDGSNVRVRIEQASACSGCRAKGFCASAEAQEKFIDCTAEGETFQTGEQVEVLVREQLGMKAVLLAYVLPFVVIIVTLAFLSQYMNNEAVTGTVALAAAAGYFLILAFASKKLKKVFTFKVRKPAK